LLLIGLRPPRNGWTGGIISFASACAAGFTNGLGWDPLQVDWLGLVGWRRHKIISNFEVFVRQNDEQ
jgi:hypothetical protein